MSTTYQTFEQLRAADAWRVVREVKDGALSDKLKKEFGAQARRMPIRILTSGLGPALAFLRAKDYAPALREALNNWIGARPWAGKSQASSLTERIIEGDAEFLRLATDECMAYLQWLVRFAESEGLIKEDND